MSKKPALDLFPDCWPNRFKKSNIGLVCHAASLNSDFKHVINLISDSFPGQLKAVFGPQHGLFGETQDNMIEWESGSAKPDGIRVHSLYGEVRHPKAEWLDDIDLMVFDLVDVGARYYTFIWTLFLCMRECEKKNIPMLVFDRPNPISNKAEGTVLDPEYSSFVGLYPLPIRHGFTIAEVAEYFKLTQYKNLDLSVVKMPNYKPESYYDGTNSGWVSPSPNMPLFDTALVYPGMCLLEGTNLNEGRGTTRPFETFGAPFINNTILKKELDALNIPGIMFRPIKYIPTFHKWSDELCEGLFMHVTDRNSFKPFYTAVALLNCINKLWPNDFKWKEPPYEYEENKLPIDILMGNSWLRKEIESGNSLKAMEDRWQQELNTFFDDLPKEVYLY